MSSASRQYIPVLMTSSCVIIVGEAVGNLLEGTLEKAPSFQFMDQRNRLQGGNDGRRRLSDREQGWTLLSLKSAEFLVFPGSS